MAIDKLTALDLREPDRQTTELNKLNELVDASFTANGADREAAGTVTGDTGLGAGTGAQGFTFSPRAAVTTLPAASVRASQATTVTALDVMPNGAPSDGGNGLAWIDVCDTDCLAGQPGIASARVGARAAVIEFGSRSFNGAALKPLQLAMNGTPALTITTDNVVHLGDTTGVALLSGTGSPEGAVTAIVGSLYLRLDGGASTTLYIKESGTGNTGWTAK